MQSSIEDRNYVATKQDVIELVKARCGAADLIGNTREVYLKILVASAQQELLLDVHSLRGRRTTPSDETIAQHVSVVDKIHESFYAAMVETVRELPVPADDKREKNVIVNSRCGFARSSYSTLRNWMIRGKHTLRDVVAKNANKVTMYQETPRRENPLAGLQKKPLINATAKILSKIMIGAKSDRQVAIDALHDVIAALTKGFEDLGVDTHEMRDALDHTATGVFEPYAMFRKAA